jgi:hypothetical protein
LAGQTCQFWLVGTKLEQGLIFKTKIGIRLKEKKKKTRPRIGFSVLIMCGIRTRTTIHVFEKEK